MPGKVAFRWVGVALLVGPAVLTGCGPSLRPPELRQGETVHRNEREGFSVRPPSPWVQVALAHEASGPTDREQLLVKYKGSPGGKMAFFRISKQDLPPDKAGAAYVRERRYGREWGRPLKFEEVQVGGLSATRILCTGYWDREKMIQEVVAVPRGRRIYYFTGIFAASGQEEARAAVRGAVASVTWEKDGAPATGS